MSRVLATQSFSSHRFHSDRFFQETSKSFSVNAISDILKENPSLVSSGDREIPTRGSMVPVVNEASPSFPLERWTRGLGFPGLHQ